MPCAYGNGSSPHTWGTLLGIGEPPGERRFIPTHVGNTMPEVHAPLPFDEAIEFFRAKAGIRTRKWDDLWKEEHARGFMVAGAMRDDMLADFQGAVLKALEKGTTLAEFQKDFDAIVDRYGWTYHGTRGWRSALIFNTNLKTAYAAGRWKQMTDPDVLKLRPYLMYKHGDSLNPRPEHLAWDGLVLPADDPWWQAHYPPNGWGCSCYVVSVSQRDLEKMGKDGPDQVPDMTPQTVKGYRVADSGIDPGWDYNVGQAAFGSRQGEEALAAWAATGEKVWERITPGSWTTYGRPETVPADVVKTLPGKAAVTVDQAASTIEKAIGGPTALIDSPLEGLSVNVNAAALAAHIDLERSKYLTLVPEAIREPYEIWQCFERNIRTGKIELRTRFIKVIREGKHRGILLVAQSRGGRMEAWTMLPTTDLKYLNRQREGKLVWSRD